MSLRRSFCFAVSVLLIMGAVLVPFASADNAWAAKKTASHQVLSGWQNNKTCYYKNGVKVKGVQKIGKAHYYFTGKGKLKTGTFTVGKTTYYCGKNGKMEAYKKGSTFYKPTGEKMAAYSAKEYKTLLTAREQLKKIVSPGDSKSTQMLKCMKWVNAGRYQINRPFENEAGWTVTFANDHFGKKDGEERYGDCISDPCAFSYLCLAIGYSDVSVGATKRDHGISKINGRYYDPVRAESKDWSRYYGYSVQKYKYMVRLLVPSYKNNYSTSSYSGTVPASVRNKDLAKKATEKKNGFFKYKGALYYCQKKKLVKSKWLKVKGDVYYFGKDGDAAVGSVKLKRNGKKSYYVFGANGKLKTGKKTRIVKVKGVSYRVTAGGKAKGGWTGSGSARSFYLANGAKATGPCLVNDTLYVFSKKGAVDEEKTTAARELMVREAPVDNLISLLGTPKKMKDSESCFILEKQDEDGVSHYMEGTDRTYTYGHLKVSTFVADGSDGDGQEYFMSAVVC